MIISPLNQYLLPNFTTLKIFVNTFFKKRRDIVRKMMYNIKK